MEGKKMKSLEEQLKLHEGIKLYPYKDTKGKWTIGVGRNLTDVGISARELLFILAGKEESCSEIEGLDAAVYYDLNNGISVIDAEYLLKNDVRKVKKELFKHDWFTQLDYVRMKIIIDMAFNLGISGLFEFDNMIKALKKKDYETAAYEMENSKWWEDVKTRAERLKKMMLTGKDYDTQDI